MGSVPCADCFCGEGACSRLGAKRPQNGSAAQPSGSKLPRHKSSIPQISGQLKVRATCGFCPGIGRPRGSPLARGRTGRSRSAGRA
ncbi:hypothetical protein DZG01_19270 [Pseudomonas fluorescens]|nr:hypothetical protein DZG01_19270 [Pseudomonas fluorescens]